MEDKYMPYRILTALLVFSVATLQVITYAQKPIELQIQRDRRLTLSANHVAYKGRQNS